MKIDYCLIEPPFKYHLSYLNGNLDYSPPQNTNWSTSLELSPELQASLLRKSNFPSPIMLVDLVVSIIPLKLQTFLTTFIDNELYNFSIEQLCFTYQNHFLCNVDYCTFWTRAMEETQDIKNDNGMYNPKAFLKSATVF